jgi:hypothetical protein
VPQAKLKEPPLQPTSSLIPRERVVTNHRGSATARQFLPASLFSIDCPIVNFRINSSNSPSTWFLPKQPRNLQTDSDIMHALRLLFLLCMSSGVVSLLQRWHSCVSGRCHVSLTRPSQVGTQVLALAADSRTTSVGPQSLSCLQSRKNSLFCGHL